MFVVIFPFSKFALAGSKKIACAMTASATLLTHSLTHSQFNSHSFGVVDVGLDWLSMISENTTKRDFVVMKMDTLG